MEIQVPTVGYPGGISPSAVLTSTGALTTTGALTSTGAISPTGVLTTTGEAYPGATTDQG